MEASSPTLTVRVTQEDIEKGWPGSCGECPVALALIRAMPYAEDVHADATYLYWYRGPNLFRHASPLQVDEFIALFDRSNGNAGEPFEFTLNADKVTSD